MENLKKKLERSVIPIEPTVLQTSAVCSMEETKGHISLHFKDIYKKKTPPHLFKSGAVSSRHKFLWHFKSFPYCSRCLCLRQTSAQWNFIRRPLLMVLLPFGSRDIPPDPALTLRHQRNVGDGDWQHLLPDLKASETSRGPPHLCSHWQLSDETRRWRQGFGAGGWRMKECHHLTPLGSDWHLVSPSDTSLKLWRSNSCQSDEESVEPALLLHVHIVILSL